MFLTFKYYTHTHTHTNTYTHTHNHEKIRRKRIAGAERPTWLGAVGKGRVLRHEIHDLSRGKDQLM